jgi:hypothetical protein
VEWFGGGWRKKGDELRGRRLELKHSLELLTVRAKVLRGNGHGIGFALRLHWNSVRGDEACKHAPHMT